MSPADDARRVPPPRAPGSGVARDLSRARESGTASAAELRSFLAAMRGKSPREMLGRIAESGLVRSTIAATVLVALLLLVLTVVPYGWERFGWREMFFTRTPDSASPTETPDAGDATGATNASNSPSAGSSAANASVVPTASGDASTAAGRAGSGPAPGAPGASASPRDEKPATARSPEQVLDRLGIGESRAAGTNVNPLESKMDDLFEGVE